MRGSCSTKPAAWPRASAEITSLGIDSDSQQQLAARAAAFLAPASPRDGSGTTVSAPDGTTLQFCDSPARTVDVSVRPSSGGRLGRDWVDANRSCRPHPAVRLLRRSSIVLSGCPGPGPASDTEFAAPFGLVRGRALSDPSGRVRIALQRTLLRRGEWAPAVPEPQHVAFATADIFATARVMRDRGAPLLTMSNNYYEDLYARFALHPGLIDAMREFGILYDREEGGEFYHLYTPVYGSRVFFEVVQRIGSYVSYGAANSAVRMSAQRRERENRLT